MYMTFIHVPNHYRLNSKLIRENLRYSFLSIFGATLLLFTIGNNTPDLFYNEQIFHLSKALIISHIWYEEKYIHNEQSYMITFGEKKMISIENFDISKEYDK